MDIQYLDLCYRISRDTHQDRKEVVHPDFIPDDGYCDPEVYQIMRLPVIRLPNNHERSKRPKTVLSLEIFVCSCFQGSIFVYLFQGKDWKSYYVKF